MQFSNGTMDDGHGDGDHLVFVVAHFFRNVDSVFALRHLFRRQFNGERRGPIRDSNMILWIKAF